jgi:hypothetical protein
LGHDEELKKNKGNKSAKAYCYLSLINGLVYRDENWLDCERRVKGVKNVKYKKAISAEDEQAIIKNWGMI